MKVTTQYAHSSSPIVVTYYIEKNTPPYNAGGEIYEP